MDNYKPKTRVLTTVDSKGRLGTQAKPGGHVLRKKQLLARSETRLDKVLDELEAAKAASARYKGLLEGIVRTHGEQALDVDFLNEACTTGAIVVETRPPNFVVVKLAAPKLVEAPAPAAPEPPPSDDPFVANLTPDARIAYEAAYAAAKDQESRAVRLK